MTNRSILDPSPDRTRSVRRLLPDLPLPAWMILVTLGILVGTGMPAHELVAAFNTGWASALGEFALILIPSFTLAAAIDRMNVKGSPMLSVGLSPLAAAGMVCPDTAYAALAAMSRRRRLEIAFGSFAGFKLLFPAGPLIVATGLGVDNGWLLVVGVALFAPVFAAGLAFARAFEPVHAQADVGGSDAKASLTVVVPLAVLCGLISLGVAFDFSGNAVLGFLVNPKGALLAAAVVSLAMIAGSERRACVESGLRRTGSLLMIIGAASALSAALALVVPLGSVFGGQGGALAILSLFALTAIFKVVQGSSMSTFAAVTPIAAPIVAVSGLAPTAAVYAICLGSFVAILPNDSFYWLVRKNALADVVESRATMILAGGSVAQAAIGLALLLAAYRILVP